MKTKNASPLAILVGGGALLCCFGCEVVVLSDNKSYKMPSGIIEKSAIK